MFLTDVPSTMPDLSCYTTNLLAHLAPDLPDVRRRLAHGVRLAVRTDLPAGHLAFSHHPRIDTGDDGSRLEAAGAPDWAATREALQHLLRRDGRVLAAGNIRHLPWSPAYGQVDAPHWLLVREHRDSRWLIADHFAALTPHGDQEPFLGWIEDAQLAAALAPTGEPAPEIARRDRLALGEEISLPPHDHYRWFARAPVPPDRQTGGTPGPGTWILGLDPALEHVSRVLCADPDAVTRHVDDLWAASRHHTFRLAFDVAAGTADSDKAAAVSTAWEELPRALRFAAQSAARGRPRPGAIERSVEQLRTALKDMRASDGP
ncbi:MULTISPECIES: hypothetical protein [unclassified Streptomyces]|uniref:hypothetical protein n=1 Tax=unclassified Streptomyces TaxID=2593676 RepID=UPI0033A0BD56